MRFLGPEWLERLASAATPAPPDLSLTIRQVVTDGPGGDVEYTLRMHGGTTSLVPPPGPGPGPVDGPDPVDVEVSEDYETAAAISQGRLSPAEAFTSGRLRVRGDVRLLVENREALAAMAAGMAGLAQATTY